MGAEGFEPPRLSDDNGVTARYISHSVMLPGGASINPPRPVGYSYYWVFYYQ